jgi:hypothetical protein
MRQMQLVYESLTIIEGRHDGVDLHDGMEHEQSKRTRKSLEQHGEDGSASHGALMLSIVARISSVLAQMRRSPSQDGRSIRLLERCERHENHNSLEDRRSPEHPPPRRSKRHESTDDRPWSFVSIMVPKPPTLSRLSHGVYEPTAAPNNGISKYMLRLLPLCSGLHTSVNTAPAKA